MWKVHQIHSQHHKLISTCKSFILVINSNRGMMVDFLDEYFFDVSLTSFMSTNIALWVTLWQRLNWCVNIKTGLLKFRISRISKSICFSTKHQSTSPWVSLIKQSISSLKSLAYGMMSFMVHVQELALKWVTLEVYASKVFGRMGVWAVHQQLEFSLQSFSCFMSSFYLQLLNPMMMLRRSGHLFDLNINQRSITLLCGQIRYSNKLRKRWKIVMPLLCSFGIMIRLITQSKNILNWRLLSVQRTRNFTSDGH